MAKQMRVGVKAAWITGGFIVGAAIITGVITLFGSSSKESNTKKIKEQKVDTGSINNYNAGRDVKIENNTFNGVTQKDTVKNNQQQRNVPMNTQPKNQIINNAPNQGVQINENKGTVNVNIPEKRNFTIDDARNILKGIPNTTKIRIELWGSDEESFSLYEQVNHSVTSLGYMNISRIIANNVSFGIGGPPKNKFQYGMENGEFLIKVFKL